jgi:hypothetical protein
MSYAQAMAKANRLAKCDGTMRFVVVECGEYHVATEFDLDTFFCGISDQNILFCTADYQN